MKKMKRRITTYRWLAAGCLLIVLLNTWMASHALGTLFEAQTWLSHTLEVAGQTQTVLSEVAAANNSVRAYMLTGEQQYEDHFAVSQANLLHAIDKLQQDTRDNDSQQERIKLLRVRIERRMASMEAAINLHRKVNGSTMDQLLIQPVLAENGDGGLTVRYILEQIEGEERRLLDLRYRESARARRNVVAAIAASAIADVLLLVLAFELLVRAQKSRIELEERSEEIAALNEELHNANVNLEARVAERTHELLVSNQELEAFSYSVSHDLRAPLRTIDGFSLALKEDFSDKLNEEGLDYIQRVRGGVQRMGTLIDALLQLSRVTRSDVQRERVDLSQLATNIFNELRASDPSRVVDWKSQPGVLAQADPRLMRVALENLIGNAWKFTSRTEAATIEFGSSSRNGQIVYFIKDNGAGFDMQYVDRLFTAFQRLHGDRDFKGSGIGLATVSRIIRRHHGTIGAEGEPGHGATFFFSLGA